MSIRSLADFMEVSPGSVRQLDRTATVTGRVDPSCGCFSEGCGLLVAKKRGRLVAVSADFLVATDNALGCDQHGFMTVSCRPLGLCGLPYEAMELCRRESRGKISTQLCLNLSLCIQSRQDSLSGISLGAKVVVTTGCVLRFPFRIKPSTGCSDAEEAD